MKCPLCEQPTSLIWTKKDFSLHQFPVKSQKESPSFFMDLRLFFCHSCHHAHLWPHPEEKVLRDFYNADYGSFYLSPMDQPGLTDGMNDPACRFIRRLMEVDFRKPPSVAEVGGYDGYVLKQLTPWAREIFLVEASSSGAAIARKHGIPVLQSFLDDDTVEPLRGRFDIVVNRHVIEHVPDPVAFVNRLKAMLAPGGLLVLETPDLAAILETALVRTVSLQHLHLFSLHSLQEVLKKCGLNVIRHDFVNSAVLAAASADAAGEISQEKLPRSNRHEVIRANASVFSDKIETLKTRLRTLVRDWKKQGKNIWIWGAGSAGGDLFRVYGLDPRDFSGYIDSDPAKAGRHFSSAPHLPILPPQEAYPRGVDAVLISTFSVQEVRRAIREMGWKSAVADLYEFMGETAAA